MFPIRVKTVQESDLRMLGDLARNIQRVLPVTQADIDAAAALGKGWVVWKVFEVSDPLDNLRGGTQLIIRQNSIQPGQNVRRVIFVSGPGGQTVVIRGTDYIVLPDAIANSLSYVKAFGGTEQRDIPDNYIQRQFIYMMDGSYLLTDIAPASNYKVEMDFQTTNVTTASEFYLGVRDVSGGVEGLAIVKRPTSSGGTLAFDGFQANNRYFSSYVPTANTRYKYTYDNGTITLTKDNTVVVSHTFTPDSTVTSKLAINGFNDNGSVLTSPTGIYLYSFKVWNAQGELVMDLVPAVEKGTVPVVGFYDTVSGAFKTATAGTFAAGSEATPTPDRPIDIVCNNGFLRFRKQSGLPDDYSLLVGLQITTAVDIGYTPKNTTKIYTKWARTRDGASQYVYRSDSLSSGTTNCTAYFGATGTGNWRFGADTRLVPAPESGTVVESVQDSTGVDINGDFYAYTTPGTFTSTQTLKVGESNGAVEFYRITIYENNVMVRDLLPVKKTSDSTYGLFDMVNNVYYQTTARVTPVVANDPVEIYADGTVETINAHGKNLFDQSTATRYKTSWNANGTIAQESVDSIAQTYGFSVKPNTTYTIQKKNGNRLMIGGFTSVKVPTSQTLTADFQIRMATTDMDSYTFTTPAGCVWILFGVRNNTVSPDLYPLATDIQIEQGSTATEYAPYYDGGTATAEMLLKVGDYQDVQSIIDGVVTRNVGVKVLDGTEDWVAASSSFTGSYYCNNILPNLLLPTSGGQVGVVTHFEIVLTASELVLNKAFISATSGGRLNLFWGASTVEQFKSWLAGQYAAGTPVIVVYPLATPTTESVAGQTLQVTDGDNVLEITQASLSGLELEAEYQAAVTLTVQEVEDANLDNNVEVTIS